MNLCAESVAAIKTVSDLAGKRRIAFVSGNFNILHPGHLRLLRFAKECGDLLVVAVLPTGAPGAFVPEPLRLEGVKSISWVDHCFLLTDPVPDFIRELKPATVIKGREWEDRENPEAKAVGEYGGKLVFGSGETSFSSIDLIQEEWKRLTTSPFQQPRDFLARHQIKPAHLRSILDSMKDLSLCVVGDTIIDEYVTCEALGMSREDPTLVVQPILSEKFIGGAAIVAAHARCLGAKVHFFSVVGNDESAAFTRSALEKAGVVPHLYVDESRPTTLKQRFRAEQKSLLRVSHLRQHSIDAGLRNRLFSDMNDLLSSVKLMVFSDFNYGCLPQPLVDNLIEAGKKRSVLMVADSQSSSQVGNVTRFQHQNLLTPTEREARIALFDSEGGLVTLAHALLKKANARNILLKMGAEGVLIYSQTDGPPTGWGEPAETPGETQGSLGEVGEFYVTDRLPAFNPAPKDVAGAGDSLLILTSMALAMGNDIWKSAYLGSLAAACQIGRMGNIPLTREDLLPHLPPG